MAEAECIVRVLHYREQGSLRIKRKSVGLVDLDRLLLCQQISVVVRLFLKEVAFEVISGKRVASHVIVLNEDLLDYRNVISIRCVERLVRVAEPLRDIK